MTARPNLVMNAGPKCKQALAHKVHQSMQGALQRPSNLRKLRPEGACQDGRQRVSNQPMLQHPPTLPTDGPAEIEKQLPNLSGGFPPVLSPKVAARAAVAFLPQAGRRRELPRRGICGILPHVARATRPRPCDAASPLTSQRHLLKGVGWVGVGLGWGWVGFPPPVPAPPGSPQSLQTRQAAPGGRGWVGLGLGWVGLGLGWVGLGLGWGWVGGLGSGA